MADVEASLDTQVRVATETAESFVASYCDAVNRLIQEAAATQTIPSLADRRTLLEAFYVRPASRYAAEPQIVANGKPLTDLHDFERLLAEQGDGTKLSIDDFDGHVVNPDFREAAPPHIVSPDTGEALLPDKNLTRAAVAVQFSGTISYGRGREAEKRTFVDSVLLVPNWDYHVKNPPKGLRRWLVQRQNFRIL